MSGRWIHRSQTAPKFYVPGFAEEKDINPLLPYLPSSAIDPDEMEKLHGFKDALPRNIGRPLVQKMSDFWDEADSVYQSTFQRLDNAHDILAHPDRFSYATLEQITDKLLAGSNKYAKSKNGNFATHVLYAVHRRLLTDDIGFKPQALQVMRTGALYEISSKAEIDAVRTTTEFVRKYRSALASKNYRSCAPFMDFIKRARRRIDYSRTFRQFTPYGTIGPSTIQSQEGDHYRVGRKGEAWQNRDFEFLDFVESWACLQSFGQSSILAGIGSEILRAVGRYDEVDLDRSTGYTFLKEIGAIPPWENRAAYGLRLPYTGRRLGVEYGYTPHTGFTEDRMVSLRKDWGELPVYCVDDHNAHEIDDGISVEATDNSDEYWIHVHVADPSAHMDPKGAAAQYAEYATETIYFPERRVPMLHEEKVANDLSLAPNRPCLTFSTKINMDGEVIDRSITPGIIRNVIYTDPSVLMKVTTGKAARKFVLYGDVSNEVEFSNLRGRSLVDADSFSEVQKKELCILHKLTSARLTHYENKGGVSLTPDRATVRVSFDGAPWTKPKSRHSYWHYGDPKIVLAVPEGEQGLDTEPSIVSTCMLLAGETAAQWSSARGIPLPFRITPRHPDEDPSKHFEKYIRPYRDRKQPIPVEALTNYFNTMGRVQPSTTPGPHLGIGVDMITRCTSPLRRFSDLVVMWQVEAALLEEARIGKSLVGNTRDDFLPFTKDRLDSMLPRMSYREKHISKLSSRADRFWSTQLLIYAWKFDRYKLPSPLIFRVRSINLDRGAAGGVLIDLQIGGQMIIPQWLGPDGELKVDDVFEVEIETIDLPHQAVTFKAIRQIALDETSTEGNCDPTQGLNES
jgi:hypothetical protein